MAPLRSIFVFLLSLGGASGFAPVSPGVQRQQQSSALNVKVDPAVYDELVADWEQQFPEFAKYGWGPTVQAEKWNGRHAMFGWFFICATAYCKGHGLIPDASKLLDYKQWGSLAYLSGTKGSYLTITNERAIILIANVHAFFVGLMATICPLPFGDTLLLDPNHPSYDAAIERNKNPFGFYPDAKFGLNEEAEILNGRMAMLGLFVLIMYSGITQQNMLDVVNDWVGKAYLPEGSFKY